MEQNYGYLMIIYACVLMLQKYKNRLLCDITTSFLYAEPLLFDSPIEGWDQVCSLHHDLQKGLLGVKMLICHSPLPKSRFSGIMY